MMGGGRAPAAVVRRRHRLEYLGLRIARAIMRRLPIDAASGFMGSVWGLVAPRLKRHQRALDHLAAAYPDASLAQREAIARAMWRQLGRVFAESFFIDRLVEAGRIEDRVAPVLAQVKASGHAVVFVSLHTGNWELAILPSLWADLPAAGVYQRVKNPLVDVYLADQRRARYPRGLFPKGGDLARKLLRIVREGGAVAMLVDLRDRTGIAVPFFGRPAPTSPFPALLARSGDARIVAARVVRLRGARFAIEGQIVDMPRTDDREADILEGTRRIHALFETWVREHPEQWMWAHRRWG